MTRIRIAIGHIEQRIEQAVQPIERTIDLFAQPQPDIERHLLIAAAARVDLVRQGADAFFQLTDDQRVDVFIGSARIKIRDSGVAAYLLKGVAKLVRFLRG